MYQITDCLNRSGEMCFVARVFDNEDDFKRLDFTLAEVSSSADWIKQAAAQNEKKRKVWATRSDIHMYSFLQ